MTNTICSLPWHHLSLQQNGDYRICCQMIHHPFGKLNTDNNDYLNIKNTSMNDVRNHEILKELRKSMLNGEQHSLCNLCWTEEASGLNSKRIFMNNQIPSDHIQYMINNTDQDG